jgi:hypothetical protein
MGNHTAGPPPTNPPDRSVWITLLVAALVLAAVAAMLVLILNES